jgi:serine protease
LRSLRTLRVSIAIALALTCALALGVTGALGANTPGTSAPSSSRGKGAPIQPGSKYVPGRVLVKFKHGASAGGLDALRGRVDAAATRVITSFGLEQLTLPAVDVPTAVDLLRASPLVEYAEPDYIRSGSFTPNDLYYTNPAHYQWNMEFAPGNGGIDMPNAWDVLPQGGSSTVVVAILDSGVAYRTGGGFTQAPDLASTHFKQGYDFINSDAYADDDNGHGTHVCGTIAQSTNNALDCAGVAFNTTVMPVKVLDQSGFGDDAAIIEGLTFAADQGVEVINMSLGGREPSEALGDACDYAFGKNVVICAASGNADLEAVEYPAAYPSCVAVGATSKAKARASYSNYGADLDVDAPGGESAAPIYQQTFKFEKKPASGFAFKGMTGTSMATPHVSGVAALVKAKNPTWSASDVRGAIASSCYDLGPAGWDPQFGWGLVDANAALHASKPSATAPAPTAVSPAFAEAGATPHLTVSGSNFSPDVKVVLERESEDGLSGSSVAESGGNKITCNTPLAGAPGLWNVVVENAALRSGSIDGGFMVDNADNKTWYLAEGSTAYGFEEYILVQNPGTAAANVTVNMMTPAGPLDPFDMSVPAQSRSTLRVNDIAQNVDVSAEVTADQDIICERAMYWANRIEGTDSIGVQSPSYTWYLAEGTTDYGFETYLLIQNPTNARTTVSVTYLTAAGPVEKPAFTIDANSRYSINVADDNDILPSKEMSFKVVADQRVIAERSMYWDGRRGGHDSIGTDMPAQNWYLAEGSTDWGYEEYVLIGNPGAEAATVTLTCMTPTGPVVQPAMSVAGGTRETVHLNESLPKKDVSVQVSADHGVVAERAMYWNNGTGKAGHEEVGVPQARQQSFLAEGSTNWGFDEWILVQNPNSSPASVGIDYMTAGGLVPKNAFTLAPNSRVSVHVNADVPGVDTSARVYSNLPIIAERSMYWNGGGAGHCSTGLMK